MKSKYVYSVPTHRKNIESNKYRSNAHEHETFDIDEFERELFDQIVDQW